MKYTIHFLRVVFICICMFSVTNKAVAQWNPNYSIGTTTGNYVYSYNQTPDPLIEIYAPLLVNSTGSTLAYQWEQSTSSPDTGFTAIAGATGATYNFSGPLLQTTYFRRWVTDLTGGQGTIVSNTFKIQVSSINWENLNYIREHDVLVPNITDWKTADQLPIGQKLQTTTYVDGLGRPLQKASKQTATPASGSSLWGDMVQFSQYDAYGRQPLQYLPYTTTNQTEIGKFKTAPLTEQPAYYTANYTDGHAYSQSSYDNSPLNRTLNIKAPGNAWAAGLGNSVTYDLNDAADSVQILSWVYGNNYPSNLGVYAANALYKNTHTDENNKQVIEYINNAGQLLLKKVQLDALPASSVTGWICTYSVYDDFGRLRYQIQPEAVKWLVANAWNFVTADGLGLLTEMCFRYDYDDKGRTVYKKAPGAQGLNMVYDNRDRIVFMQDGNQAVKPTPEWTTNIYDELDRLTMVALYHTTQSIAILQTNLTAGASGNVSITNAGQPIIDLVLDNRNQTTANTIAQNSISLVSDAGGDFTTIDGEEFVAAIDASAASAPITTTSATYSNAISQADLNNPTVTTILKYLYYDDYSFAGAKTFDNNFNNALAYSGDPAYLPIATSQRTISYPTGSMVRVLNTNTFLASTHYYDEKGRAIQTIEDNIKSGTDVTTRQYHWDGRLLSSQTKHSTALTGYNSFSVLTKYLFDNIGRVTSLQKLYDGNTFKTIANYDYDDVGRLKNKHLDPGYTGSGKSEMESLMYSYNIHSQITGINKDYALKNTGYNKWNNFFGLYIGFDNSDNTFNTANLNGQVTGLLWSTQGDDVQRKYDYTYDNAGRLIKAAFNERQNTGDPWSNGKMDFSVGGNGTNGTIQYDLNGNLLSMLQKGVIPGQGVVTVDNLTYSYKSYSNKLASVTDSGTLGNLNGLLGDFKDGSNGSADDYVYDNNGNVVVDLNKNATDLNSIAGGNGISYNYLDKPDQIRIKGKGLIQIVYDADGNKLQKIYTPETGTTGTATTYINQFVYTETATITSSVAVPINGSSPTLSYINFEEGRIRVMQPVSIGNGYDAVVLDGNMVLPAGKKGAYDFYIRDYQQNVRMIVTEETHSGNNICTMEMARAGAEDPVFGQTGSANEVVTTRFDATQIPGTWPGNTAGSVSKLYKTGHAIGPNSLLKVMAGDNITATTQYYYQGSATNNSANSLATDVITNLLSVINGSSVTSAVTKGSTTAIGNNLNATLPFVNTTDPDKATTDSLPRAYLSVVFFDERFNFVAEHSTVLRVNSNNNSSLTIPNIQAPKNGYAYIYLSNESDVPVYFDNFNVAFNRGRLIEENHYYAYGLKIAGISSKKLGDPNEGSLKNNNLYNDKEIDDEADLNWLDYGFRNYDAQIGRFVQLDPLTDETPALSGYHYALNDPITNIDEDGLSAVSKVLQQVACAGDKVGTGLKVMDIISLSINTIKIGADYGQERSTGNQIGNTLNGKTVQQVGGQGNNYVKFTKTALDLDGGKDAYADDDEGTDFLSNAGAFDDNPYGVIKLDDKWVRQKGSTHKLVSPTAAAKKTNLSETDQDRYYDPESDAYIALNYELKSIGFRKGDRAIVENVANGKKSVVIIADVANTKRATGILEMSPEAARILGIKYSFKVPGKKYFKSDGSNYINKKYLGVKDTYTKVYKYGSESLGLWERVKLFIKNLIK